MSAEHVRQEGKLPKGKLHHGKLYLGDNGRCFCGRIRCAGMTPFYTGRDLSGQRVEVVPPALAREHGLRCEMCGSTGGAKT